MSNFIHGLIINDGLKEIPYLSIKNKLVQHCKDNDFSINFSEKSVSKDEHIISFLLSDNYLINYCENFMEPITYSIEGEPLLEGLLRDIDKLQKMIMNIFSYECVKMVVLKFSFVEVDEGEYEICRTNVNDVKKTILNKYLRSLNMPVIKVLIER